jgi:HEAT repeat protein
MKNPFQRIRDQKFEKAIALLNRVHGGETIENRQLHAAVKNLIKSGNSVAIQTLEEMTGHREKNIRVMAAEALSKLGKTHWRTLILGDDQDYDRLAASSTPEALKVLIESFRTDQNSLARDAILGSNNYLVTRALMDSLKLGADRIPVINMLGDLKDSQATQLLLRYSRNLAVKERKSAIIALGKIGDESSIEPLFDLLNDKKVKEVAADAIIEIGGQQTIDSIIDKLTDLDKDKRIEAADQLARLRESKWKEVVRGENDDFTRLGETGDERFFTPLARLLESGSCHTNPELKCAVICGLAALRDPDCIELLLNNLLHPSTEVRRITAKAIQTLGEPSWANLIKGEDQDFARLASSDEYLAVELLIRFLNDYENDRHSAEYEHAEKALETAYHPGALEIFMKAIEPGNTDTVRRHAAEALGKIGDSVAVGPLLEALRNDENEDVRQWAALSLGRIGDPKSLNAIWNAVSEPSGPLRRASSEALAKSGDPYWENLIKGDDEDYSRLGSDGSSRSVELLLSMIRNYGQRPDDLSKELELAKTALEKVKNPEAMDTLLDYLKDKKVQASVILAIGEIGDPRAVEILTGLWEKLSGRHSFPIIKALARIGDSHAVESLTGHITDELNLESVEIILVLSEIDVGLVIKSLRALRNINIMQNALITPAGKLRLALAREISKSGDLFWEELIKGDNRDYIQLASSGNPRAVELLVSMINAYTLKRRALDHELALARDALAHINRPEALDTLIKVVDNESVQADVIRVMGEIGDPLAVNTLVSLWDDSPYTKLIINALVKIGDKTAIEELVWKLVYHFDDNINKIINILGETDNSLTVEALVELLYRPDMQSRTTAAKVLMRIVSSDFRSMGSRWKEISQLIRNPHEDFIEGKSCSGDYEHYDSEVHTDTGIGLEIPPELQ